MTQQPIVFPFLGVGVMVIMEDNPVLPSRVLGIHSTTALGTLA